LSCSKVSTTSRRAPGCRSCSSPCGQHALVVADLTEADFVDSSVINSLVQANRAASAPDAGRLVLQCCGDAVVYRVLEVTGILGMIEWSSTRDGAVRNGS
jgi:anti-anti-sigma regulatory factor